MKTDREQLLEIIQHCRDKYGYRVGSQIVADHMGIKLATLHNMTSKRYQQPINKYKLHYLLANVDNL